MKVLTGIATAGLIAALGAQQYQLMQISTAVTEIKMELKFVNQSSVTQASFSEQDEACLARNIYYEAGVEDEIGKAAVAQVTLNRLNTGKWGNTICKVVYAKSQFSWTLKKKLPKPSGKAWEDSQWIAHRALRGDSVPALKTAQFYHADYVSPKWKDTGAKIAQVGTHIFYTKAKSKA